MDPLAKTAGRLAALCAAALALSLVTAATAAAEPLLPDLVTRPINQHDLVMSKPGAKHPELSLTNEVANVGRGPLELFASATSSNCDGDGDPGNDRDAIQRVFEDDDDGVFDRAADTAFTTHLVACERQLYPYYWQIYNLARYRLLDPNTGQVAARTNKVSYCTVDSMLEFPALPGAPEDRYYPQGSCGPDGTLGISIGWADAYVAGSPGQSIDLSGLARGRYCLTSQANPRRLLIEGGEAADPYGNNGREALVRLRPNAGLVSRIRGTCEPG